MTHGKDWMVGASTCSVGKATPEVVRAYAEAGLDAMEISLKAHEYASICPRCAAPQTKQG